ncbi:MAG: hypothetical protein JOY58_07345 [Solirubrobacterales bacterium]|nr:hypothetical protein [Solirubrobacterales bacterium]MBV9048066.1 hypothetical protein [Solirubrobacterales bacterium]
MPWSPLNVTALGHGRLSLTRRRNVDPRIDGGAVRALLLDAYSSSEDFVAALCFDR